MDGQDYSSAGPTADPAENEEPRPRQDTAEDELLAQHPGLIAFFKGQLPSTGATSSGEIAPSPDEGFSMKDPVDMEDDDARQAFYDAVERRRPDLEGVAPVAYRDFRAKLRFNQDGYQGQVVRHGAAQAWCMAKRLQQTKQFNIEVGEEPARILAEAWCHRMQLLYDADMDGLLSDPATKAATLEAMEEPPEFVALLVGANDAILGYAMLIRDMVPR